MAASAAQWTGRLPFSPAKEEAPARRTSSAATPEIYFGKAIDNHRVVKIADPKRNREIRQFTAATVSLFVLVLIFVVQHFCSIQYGYRIEEQKKLRDNLVEINRQLRLEEASLRDPDRIDHLARQIGMQAPQAGQLVPIENTADNSQPVMAKAWGIAVITAIQ